MVKLTRWLLLACSIALIAFDACSPLYVPNAPHVPLFTNKRQVHGTVLFDGLSGGFDGQASWSPIRNFSVVGSALWVPKIDSSTGQEYVEGGVGGYLPLYTIRSRMANGFLGLTGPRDAWATYVAELFVGAGRGTSRGNTRDLFAPAERAADVGFGRLFMQGALFGRYGREHIRGELLLGLSRTDRDAIPFDRMQFFVAIGVEFEF